MKPSLLVIIVVAASVVFVGLTGGYFAVSQQRQAQELEQSRRAGSRLEEEVSLIRAEKEKVLQAKEKLEADTVSFLAANTKLSEEKEKLLQKITEDQKKYQDTIAQLEVEAKKLQERQKQADAGLALEKAALAQEKKELLAKLQLAEQEAAARQARFHYNLGVAYTKAKMYDEAVQEYEQSLKLKEAHAEAHYNLGLLYDTVRNDKALALKHYQRYLELDPQGKDAPEVSSWIKRLQ